MRKINELADLCWEGFSLKHVSCKQVVIPYLLFLSLTFLFELFLAFLFILSLFLFHSFGYKPNVLYYISGMILVLMLTMTIPLLITVIKGNKHGTGSPA
ncbi:hypothetical protein [Bacillus sp. USDA818B3_A]|uniref:hypothetical protein n=1 Tax=Bacillus sp. USDA818B3_A TaxID=2698834 RepID=UPI001369BC09|nr:hypothetical protein [Bacillus sp. USDA818B3_A]